MNLPRLFSFFPFLFFLLVLHTQVRAQSSAYSIDWQLLDPVADTIYGTSVNKAYQELLKDKKPHKVIVAVIDSGVDTAHQDLQGKIWVNKGEVVGNHRDDDGNGYVDDIHGWNFLGGKDSSIKKESSEMDRVYYTLEKKFATIDNSSEVKKKDRKDFKLWQEVKAKKTKDIKKDKEDLMNVKLGLGRYQILTEILETHLNTDSVRLEDLDRLDTSNDTLMAAKMIVSQVLKSQGPEATLEGFLSDGEEYLKSLESKVKWNPHADPDSLRRLIVGDNPEDIKDRHYGNNNVAGRFGKHATHVAGIIAAVRHNGIGMDGIAGDVEIMPVRAVPDGDERDKDIALAIRYAVKNGAQIINMSFGKPYSPQKKWVDEAVKYAQRHNVLLVHAAGNDNKNNDSVGNYPNPVFLKKKFLSKKHQEAKTFITVGASNPTNEDGNLPADFSNYGKNTVDLFAPGVNIYSTVPDNEYASLSGTSMASPVVAGVAALVLSYYPHLSAKQLKWVLLHSVTKLDSLSVNRPGSDDKVPFGDLSRTGGVVNAYNALKLAATLK